MQLSSRATEILLEMGAGLIRQNLTLAAGGTVVNPLIFPDEPELLQKAGCFVSLHEKQTHQLRGCIGILESEQSLRETLAAAAEGVLKDPRFVTQPVMLEELAQLEIEVTVIGPMRPAASPLDFDPMEHGIFLTIGTRSGCFLPQVGRETGWTREQLLARLCTEKMGLGGDAWKRADAKLRVFNAQVVGPLGF
jgi:AmmeMemoRadiSam system protein A